MKQSEKVKLSAWLNTNYYVHILHFHKVIEMKEPTLIKIEGFSIDSCKEGNLGFCTSQ